VDLKDGNECSLSKNTETQRSTCLLCQNDDLKLRLDVLLTDWLLSGWSLKDCCNACGPWGFNVLGSLVKLFYSHVITEQHKSLKEPGEMMKNQ
jgi:hypothetical protein